MRLKKLAALVVALSMIVGLFAIPNMTVHAQEKATLSFIYMGKVSDDDEYLEQYPEEEKTVDDLNVGDSFWVGIRVSNMSNIKDILEGVGDEGGILSLTFRIAYDDTILTPHEYADYNSMFNQNTYLQTVYPTFPNGRNQDPMYSVIEAEYTNPEADSQNNETLSVSNVKDVKMIIRLTNNMRAKNTPRLFQQNINDDPIILAMFAFTVKSKPDGGKTVLQGERAADSFVIETGWDSAHSESYCWFNTVSANNLKDYFEVENNAVVDIFPAGAPEKNGIDVSGAKTTYYITDDEETTGTAADYGKVTYTWTSDHAEEEVQPEDIELYYGDDGDQTDASSLTKIDDNKIKLDMNGKYLYVVEKNHSSEATYVKNVGQLTVTKVAVDTLTKSGDIPQQYIGKAPTYDGITVTANYNNSTNADVTESVTWKYATSTGIVDAGDGGLQDMPKAWEDGTTRYLYAVYGGKIVEIGEFTPIAVTVTEIKAVNGTISGAVGDNVLAAADGVKATFTLSDGTEYTDVDVLGAIADNSTYPELKNFGLYVRKGDGPAYTYEKVEAGTTLEKDMVIVITDATQSVVSEPITLSIDTSAIVKIEVTNNVEAIENQHVTAVLDKAGDKFKFVATDAGGIETTYNLFDTYTAAGYKLQIKGADGTWTDVDANTRFALGDNTFKVVKGAVESDEFTITASGKKASSLATSGAPTGVTYGDAVDLSGVTVTVTYDNGETEQVPYSDFESKGLSVEFGGSALSPGATYAAGTNTFTVNGPDGSTTTIEVKAGKKTVTLTASGTAEKTYDGTTALPVGAVITYGIDGLVATDSYTVTADAAFASKNASDSATITISNPQVTGDDFDTKYTLSTTTLPTLTGKINKADITVTAITDELSMKEGKTATGEKEMALTANNSTGLISGDTVSLKYTWTFTDPNTVSDSAEVTISGTSLTGADSGNYNLAAAPATTTGKVVELSVTSITATSAEYTYPNLVPTITVTGTTEDNQTIDISLDDCTLTVNGEPFDITQPLPYGETVVTVDYEGITTTVTLKANKKTINIDDVVFDVTRTLGVATVNSATINAGVEDADKENVSVNLEGITATLSGTDAVLTGITLTGDAAENYVLSSDTKTVATTLVKADQDAPAAPKVTVDPKTNKLVAESVVSPNGTAVQYFVNGEGPKTEEELEAMELEQGKEYDVKVKFAGSDDYNESPDSSVTVVTAHKYLVKLVAARGGAEYAAVYTDEVTVADSAALLELLGVTAPKNVKEYYYLETVEGTETEMPIENYAVNGDWTVYYTVSTGSRPGGNFSGGGGSTVTSYTVSYSAGSHGGFAEDAKTRETVSINGKPSNVPSVTAEEGWTFAGWSTDGETIVDPTQVTITKNTTFTALYEKDGSVDVQPPAIDAEYTKPYAAGYPDGTFMPDNNITRAELAAMIARLSYGDDIPSSYVASFPDVAADAWYSKYVGYLEGLNVLTGYNDGTFQPENTITRAEVCAVIARAQKMSLLTYEDGLFTDVEADYWASQYIETLEANGIISGYADGSFGPASPITRAETVTIINRVLAPSTPVENVIPSDISGHWAENDIILAVNERQLIK